MFRILIEVCPTRISYCSAHMKSMPETRSLYKGPAFP